jgi:hypothetical protein
VTMEVMQGLSYGQEITASWCGEGYYLFGCLLCGLWFSILDEGYGKGRSRHRPLISVYCCINNAERLGEQQQEECRHAVYSHCWNKV